MNAVANDELVANTEPETGVFVANAESSVNAPHSASVSQNRDIVVTIARLANVAARAVDAAAAGDAQLVG